VTAEASKWGKAEARRFLDGFQLQVPEK
jgi:hypothetical protein